MKRSAVSRQLLVVNRQFGLGVLAGKNRRVGAAARCGFTLVELLVVMVIIGILAGLGVRVAYKALIHGKNASIRMEIAQLDAALKAYKEKFGEYPPDGTDNDVTLQHLRRAFPRWTGSSLPSYLSSGTANLCPQTALAFWLGGIPDDTTHVPCGFAADPTNPFQTPAQCAARIKPFYEFDSSQFVGGAVAGTGTMTSYHCWPRQALGNKTSGALLYLRATNGTYTATNNNNLYTDAGDSTGVVYPAVNSQITNARVWINASSYQIFSAGLDTKFGDTGGPINYPKGEDNSASGGNGGKAYANETYDNITNFSKGTLEDDIP